MRFKGIAKRWLANSFGLMLVILLVLILSVATIVHSYYYSGISQMLYGNAVGISTYFSGNTDSSEEFISTARSYVQSFQNKEQMEASVYDSNNTCFITSTGFAADDSQDMPDYDMAKLSDDGYGEWVGHLSSGEHVMAVTQAIYNPFGDYMGAVRYVVSLQEADQTIATVIVLISLLGILIAVATMISNAYFIRSITKPILEINDAAKQVAVGDFSARLKNPGNNEVGELCDTINYMVSELENSEKMKNDFISSISHEIRTPLTAIKGWAETMIMPEEMDIDRETMNKGMNIIVHETERLSGIVEELLDFSRMQNKSMVYMPEKIDLLAELDEAIYMYKEKAVSEHKHLIFEGPETLSPVMADKNRMKQVFINVIDNALKYTPEAGTVTVTTKEDDVNVYVLISDNGCGISATDLPRIKEKFYKANHQKPGSGIGLAVANEIMLLHAGSLRIESEENVGTTVIISMPHIKSDQIEK